MLAKEGFIVMPYMYPDLNAARDLEHAGAACISWLGAPIGTNKGLCTREFIKILIEEIDLPIIVDAGIGRPSQACEAMEMALPQSWQIQPLPLPATYPPWRKPLKKPLKQDVPHTCRALGAL